MSALKKWSFLFILFFIAACPDLGIVSSLYAGDFANDAGSVNSSVTSGGTTLDASYQLYGWWQIIICTFAVLGLFFIQASVRKQTNLQDRGWFYLSLSIAIWGVIGILYVGIDILQDYLNILQTDAEIKRAEGILSILNSYLILMALPWFNYIPKWLATYFSLRSKINDQNTKRANGNNVFETYTSILAFIALTLVVTNKQNILEPDVIYGNFTIIILTSVLYKTFKERQKKGLAYLAGLSLTIAAIAQILKIIDGTELWRLILSASFKTMLAILFFSLVLTWAEEIRNRISPQKIFLRLLSFLTLIDGVIQEKKAMIVNIPGYAENTMVEYESTAFKYLQKLVDGLTEVKGDGFVSVNSLIAAEAEPEDHPKTRESDVSQNSKQKAQRFTSEQVEKENEASMEAHDFEPITATVPTADEVITSIIMPILRESAGEKAKSDGLTTLREELFDESQEGKIRFNVPLNNIFIPPTQVIGNDLTNQIFLTLVPMSTIAPPKQSCPFAIVTIPGYCYKKVITFTDVVFQRLFLAFVKQKTNKDSGCLIQGRDYNQDNDLRVIINVIAKAINSDREADIVKELWPVFFISSKKQGYTNGKGLCLKIPINNIDLIGVDQNNVKVLQSVLRAYRLMND